MKNHARPDILIQPTTEADIVEERDKNEERR